MACHNTIKDVPIQYHSISLRNKSEWLNMKRSGIKLNNRYLKKW